MNNDIEHRQFWEESKTPIIFRHFGNVPFDEWGLINEKEVIEAIKNKIIQDKTKLVYCGVSKGKRFYCSTVRKFFLNES